jgi:hypothetical protein
MRFFAVGLFHESYSILDFNCYADDFLIMSFNSQVNSNVYVAQSELENIAN